MNDKLIPGVNRETIRQAGQSAWLDSVDIHFDWLVPARAGDPLIFHLDIKRGNRTSAVRFQLDLARLAPADMALLHEFLLRQRSGLRDDYAFARSLTWLLDLSLQQSGAAVDQIDERLIKEGLIESYVPSQPGKKGRLRLIDLDSFEAWAKGAKGKSPEATPSILPNFTRWVKGETPQKVLP